MGRVTPGPAGLGPGRARSYPRTSTAGALLYYNPNNTVYKLESYEEVTIPPVGAVATGPGDTVDSPTPVPVGGSGKLGLAFHYVEGELGSLGGLDIMRVWMCRSLNGRV